ncbi:hypothetical protein BDR05DRAFT_805984 [Suillus weaverae]|nr:hypothetical protein BDR05DRAFT_805984 [Suillus weaverae]
MYLKILMLLPNHDTQHSTIYRRCKFYSLHPLQEIQDKTRRLQPSQGSDSDPRLYHPRPSKDRGFGQCHHPCLDSLAESTTCILTSPLDSTQPPGSMKESQIGVHNNHCTTSVSQVLLVYLASVGVPTVRYSWMPGIMLLTSRVIAVPC